MHKIKYMQTVYKIAIMLGNNKVLMGYCIQGTYEAPGGCWCRWIVTSVSLDTSIDTPIFAAMAKHTNISRLI